MSHSYVGPDGAEVPVTDYRSIIETPRKWDLLRHMGRRFGLDTLVETGGYHGATMEYLRGDFRRLVTVELGDALFEDIYRRDILNVLCLKGDSSRVLRQFLLFFSDPALFWLDAHPSGGDTVGAVDVLDGTVASPTAGEELVAVLERGNQLDVILVDDVGNVGLERDFIKALVAEFPNWEVRFSGEWPNAIAMVTAKGRISGEND